MEGKLQKYMNENINHRKIQLHCFIIVTKNCNMLWVLEGGELHTTLCDFKGTLQRLFSIIFLTKTVGCAKVCTENACENYFQQYCYG